MKFQKLFQNKIIISFFIIISLISQITCGIIVPDDILPLEISPSYENTQGKKGTKFVFRFYIPNNVDKDSMPTMRGYGATNGQYIGLRFTPEATNNLFNTGSVGHTCEIIQTDNNLNISTIALNDKYSTGKNVIYCKIDSYSNEKILLPGYNYKLTITILNDLSTDINNLISITLFTSTAPNSEENDIIDIGTFNHINILRPHTPSNQVNSVATLSPETSGINIEVETDFNFDVRIIFNIWFSWDDYIICLDLPKSQVSADNPVMEIARTSGSSIELPYGDITTVNLESNDKRKFIGFFLDGSNKEYKAGDILLLKFSGFKTKDAGLITEQNTADSIGIQIRYRNSYVISSSASIPFTVSLGNVQFTVKHPETSDDETYKFDVYKGGAFQIEFNIKTEKNVYNKYIVIKQKNSGTYQRVTFIASSCDFSDFNITSNNFNEIPKCYPIKNRNNIESNSDNYNGIFFYYPYLIRANINYKIRVWMFFDECGPEDDVLSYLGDRTKIEIKFSLEMYNDINKNKIAENRFDSNYIFLTEKVTEKGITCYNTYMGEKKYNNGYTFNMNEYSNANKLFYREYFNWNVYDHSSESSADADGERILNNLFESENISPKFIYPNLEENKIKDGSNLLLISKITLDSGDNEKLGQFFPMGLTKGADGITAIQGKFFIKLSKNFFQKAETSQCYVSWTFGSPSISKDKELNWKPKSKSTPRQKYNFIVSSNDFFEGDSTAIYEPLIEKIEDNYLESSKNEGWDATKALWSFGDDENLEDQISDEAPVDIYFALVDTCHVWKNTEQNISSLYTPIEVIVGIKGDSDEYYRVMRFIKLYPETGVWHDNTINKGSDRFIRSSNFIVKNHFAFNKVETLENTGNDKGVCLLEILPGLLDTQKGSSTNFFLWIFMGSLLDTEYTLTQATYPIGNLADNVQAYGYSSQHSLNPNNFYAKASKTQNSDVTSPIYNIAYSMTSLYQSKATSGYLFYLGSLIVLYNKAKRNSIYDLASSPIYIPYYCPYYNSKDGQKKPFGLGIFPSFIGGFGSFESITNLGNKGFDKLIGQEISDVQTNILMLSDIKIFQENFKAELKHYYNTVKFINDYSSNLKTLNIWNSDETKPCKNEYDSIDSFIFFFNEKITDLNSQYPRSNIPQSLKSIAKSKKGNYCFYVYGKKFCSGVYGVTNKDVVLTRNIPSTGDVNPYLSINLNFEISSSSLICESNTNKFCPEDVVAFWGISANHDMPSYVTNFLIDSYLLDYHIYTEYINNDPPSFELGQSLAFKNDPAIYVKIIFNSPFENAILSNTILSFTIKDITDAHCSVQSSDVNLPSVNCDTSTTGEISCNLVFSSLKYNIFCYDLNYGSNGRFYFNNFKLNLPNERTYSGLGTLIFHDTSEYILNIPNKIIEPLAPTIQGNYITNPSNINSYSKLELTIDLKRPAHPGMVIEIAFDKQTYFDTTSECKFSLEKINTYSLSDIDIDAFWTQGNANVYNCIIYPDSTGGSTVYKIISKLDSTLYKAGNVLSNLAYVYIWPFKTIELDSYVELNVEVNGRYILSYNTPNSYQVSFSSIDQHIDPLESITNNNIIESIIPSSNILGDISDYTFNIDKSLTTINYNEISSTQIFFPKDINFECEECVKCYEIKTGNKITMITCNFIDNNILNVFFSTNMGSIDSFIVTGIINPKKQSLSSYLFFNWVYIDYLGNRYSEYNSNFILSNIKFTNSPKIEHLRFFYYKSAVSDSNPRNTATYTFHVSFDYANPTSAITSLPGLSKNGIMYIYFPRDYHLYINNNPTGINVIYNYISGNPVSYNVDGRILGNKIQIEISQATSTTVKLKYIEIIIKNIKNPNKITNNNKYTGYFKIVCLNSPSSLQSDTTGTITPYYYTTGINSNTYRSNYITNQNERSGEYNWYRGHLIKTNDTYVDKLYVDVLYDNKVYDFIFLQPGRYKKVHFVTSSDSEKESNFYLNPDYTEIYFPSNSKVKTLEDKYILPSLVGEAFEFYIGVPCTTNDGIYNVTPTLSNSNSYLSPPSIIINVRQIETGTVEFIQNDIGVSPLNGKSRIYYYLSDINVDELNVFWNKNFDSDKVNIDSINIPPKTITDKSKKLSNVFASATILITDSSRNPDQSYYFISSENINRCYKLYPESLELRESDKYSFLEFDNSYRLSQDLTISTSENDDTLLSNEIKFLFNPPRLEPSFILCELYCPYLTPEGQSSLLFLNYDSMNRYLATVKQNYFRKYATANFVFTKDSSWLIFPGVIKGYNYNAQCVYQTTQSDATLINHKLCTFTSDNLRSTYPPKTLCNTFYFLNAVKEEVQKKYVYYCQYIIGNILGLDGCVICSDCSGKIISPGFSLYFPFNCNKEQCYDQSSNELLSEMYDLANEFNINSGTTKYEFTVCVTSNRICSSQITNDNLNSAFNQFINNVKDNENANDLFEIDYSDNNYIIYNSFYQNKIYSEYTIDISDIKIEFIEELNSNGNALIKASYAKEISYNLLCFWRIKPTEDDEPNLEEMTNCKLEETHCGVFVANYEGHQYRIPEGKRKNLDTGFYSMYVTCSHFVPSPIYFSSIKLVSTKEIVSVSFSGKILYIKYIYLLLFISLLL